MAQRLGFPDDPTVVLADADRSVDDPVITSLVAEGFHLVLTGSGEEALQALLAVKPDVMVVNSDLPDMSGLSVLRRVRSLGCVPVLVLSEPGDESEVVLAFEMGARDYLRGCAYIRETAARIPDLPTWRAESPRSLWTSGDRIGVTVGTNALARRSRLGWVGQSTPHELSHGSLAGHLTFRTSGDPFTSPTPRLARRVGSRRLQALRRAL
jgi:DNA-binding response OmpR family regulator